MSPHLRPLHWLPIRQHIQFKWCLLIYKVIHFDLPPYFSPYFIPYTCKIAMRCSVPSNMTLDRDIIPFSPSVYKSKVQFNNSFCVSGPCIWNKLLVKVCCAEPYLSLHDSLRVTSSIVLSFLSFIFRC